MSSIKVVCVKHKQVWVQVQFTDTLSGPGYKLVAGKMPQAAWLLIDSTGKVLKAFHYSSSGDQQPGDLAVSAAGSMFSAGAFLAETPWHLPKGSLPGHGALDAWLLRFQPNGEFDWGMAAGGFNNDVGLAIFSGPDDNIWLGGMGSTLAFDNQQILSGQTGALLARFSPKARVKWAKGFSASMFAAFHDVWVDSIGRALAVGQVMGELVVETDTLQGNGFAQPFWVFLNDSGKVIKYNRILCSSDAVFEQVTGAGSSGYVLSGQFQGKLLVASDSLVGEEGVFRPFVVWLNPSCAESGLITVPSIASQGTPALCAASNGGIWVGFALASTSGDASLSTMRIQYVKEAKKPGVKAEFSIPYGTRVSGVQTTAWGTLVVSGEALESLVDNRTRCWMKEIPIPKH